LRGEKRGSRNFVKIRGGWVIGRKKTRPRSPDVHGKKKESGPTKPQGFSPLGAPATKGRLGNEKHHPSSIGGKAR